jgi:TPP-dependent 2-oxoacid decarboxylase
VAVLPKEDSETITHAWLWPRMSKFFRPRDVIVAETGPCSLIPGTSTTHTAQAPLISACWTSPCPSRPSS